MTTDPEYLKIVMHLSVALLIGGAIGLERSYHGRRASVPMRWFAFHRAR